MYIIEITPLNDHACNAHLDDWLTENAANYTGFSIGSVMRIYLTAAPSPAEEQAIIDFYNAVTEADCLDNYKEQKILEIQYRTDQMIDLGYVHSGLVFPLTREAEGDYTQDPQTNILALFSTRSDLTYPIDFNTINGLNVYSCPDAATIEAMYMTALATKKSHLDSGTALNNLVRAATTKAEVFAVTDLR